MVGYRNSGGFNIDKLSLRELVDLETRITHAITIARDRERSSLKEKMAELAESHGFSVAELFGAGSRAKGIGRQKPVGNPKYQHPSNREQTWTGRGRKPNWLVDLLNDGASLKDFEV